MPQVAPVFPLVGTTSFTLSTKVGGFGLTKDAKHAKLMALGGFIAKMREQNLITQLHAEKATYNVVNKLLKKVCGRDYVLNSEEVKENTDEEITGNGGNL